MLYEAEVAVCSEINTKQINTLWAECQLISFKPVGAHSQLLTYSMVQSSS
jgi:hypothetical protein